ncbi:FtsX-like permease family protein [Nitratidesulfovibrio sp. SRB-5]|uniref:FtsX-like permease family protein n=1 Tax=Nitratidesulfovibrio sp. SRB-5 TaxID=2872636 RepID=UPI0010285A16|nr:FtsX-like permease family protein [Nitratidesulfovibrio sp. SRB-5]MBZ2172968.1 ABC transporter permease [Nitratidesulfovibrio sp. SRB-5]RXF78497.1 FtsX-like permease family protein [Desulfovibrio sp. DS-1]
MILEIACRNLFHDRVRLVVTLTGIVFAVVLVTIQCGLFLGFITTISGVVDNSQADLWVTSRGVKTFDIAMPMPESRVQQVLGVEGVADAAGMVVDFSFWKKPDGGQESIEIIAFEKRKGLGGPWNMIEGDATRLDAEDSVIMDTLYLEKLGVTSLGEQVEIVAHRARVMGFTIGIRSFTTSPYVFTDYRNGHLYSRFAPGQITYVLVKADPGADMDELRRRIAGQVAHVDVFTTREFSQKTREYWMLSTGAGGALVLAALLGLVVGMVIVAQTLYATTMDHLPEFATLKAMGAPDGYILRIIMGQAVISALLGYGLGMGICFTIAHLRRYGETAIILSPALALGMFFLTLFMCVAASVISIRKVLVIDPAIVFKGR